MKKSFFSVAIFATLLFTSCDPKEPQIKEVESIKLSENALVLEVGQSQTLTADILPAEAINKLVTWASSDAAIASVANGVVTANAAGTAIIIAKADNKADTCEVSVFINPLTYDEGVVINDVKWATRNVDTFGKFVANPEDAGMLYQWNRPTAWAATGDVTGWDNTFPTGTTWEAANDPCPNGWRVPTKDELDGLAGATYTWTTNGMLFGNGSNTIFLPAAGLRRYSDGTLRDVGTYGYYWSSTESIFGQAYFLYFYSGGANLDSNFKTYGCSVRCVAE